MGQSNFYGCSTMPLKGSAAFSIKAKKCGNNIRFKVVSFNQSMACVGLYLFNQAIGQMNNKYIGLHLASYAFMQ